MPIHIADIASYQGDLHPDDLLDAGFTAVNVKVSHGLTQKSVHPRAAAWLSDERFQISTFHWLDGSASGAAQAGHAYMRMVELISAPRLRHCAHVVDCESDATELIWRDYCATMATLLKRPIATYTGDWWWKWGTASSMFSPWLWAAPNAGYLQQYPGDDSEHWRAGYGGWAELSVMQYAVLPVAGIKVSMSAVRGAATWNAMRGVTDVVVWRNTPASLSLLEEFNEAFPSRSKASDGSIGDPPHAARSSNHNPDETGVTPREDSDSINEVHARDIDKDLNRPGWSMTRCVNIILDRCRRGVEKRVFEIIWNRKIWTEAYGWRERDYAGDNPHTEHAHFSIKYGSGSGTSNPENITAPWGILAAIEEEDMADANVVSFSAAARDVLTTEAVEGGLGYKGGGMVAADEPAYIAPRPDGNGVLQPANILAYQRQLFNQVAELHARPAVTVDIEALAAAIVAQLPDLEIQLTEDDVVTAVKTALREGTHGE